jgi:hypothetical protein
MLARRNKSFTLSQAETLRMACMESIRQCLQLLDSLTPLTFNFHYPQTASVGTHIRHIIDRYACFFAGLAARSIDYDARARDLELQENLLLAKSTLQSLKLQLLDLNLGSVPAFEVWETVSLDHPATMAVSTIQRELMALLSHSIHHLAMAAMTAKAQGITIDVDLGKALSTLCFEGRARFK